MALFRNSLTENWRRGPELNRRIEVLQTSALPLGYRALQGSRNFALAPRHRKPKHTPPRFRSAARGSDARSAGTARCLRSPAPRRPRRSGRNDAPTADGRRPAANPAARTRAKAPRERRDLGPRQQRSRWKAETWRQRYRGTVGVANQKKAPGPKARRRENCGSLTQAFASPAAGAGVSAAGAAGALALALPLPFAARRPEDFL